MDLQEIQFATIPSFTIKSRMGKAWSYGVNYMAVERIRSGAIVEKEGALLLSEDFLKGMAVPPKLHNKK